MFCTDHVLSQITKKDEVINYLNSLKKLSKQTTTMDWGFHTLKIKVKLSIMACK